ncbi:hypothetical protein BB559_004480 [Furculomyces boomerangus]|uniref:t-SNARE coiled-coil homology domain-containing protein n=2 Tax=Harpellales TaxID=61421 RepID=A0A2T9YEJ2_9FUNG|nr:hypothetical protein BB559_005471 [Furculomyces boomerangus]PVU90729.1 hypothetical protein BB559_004480 [Furculomyces boomerangus]PWA00025.1 hypothetical protein BB558_003930 [Smittium angustum]PWA02487.1 hypothetical protein BB558_001328 [Smittium angustum]
MAMNKENIRFIRIPVAELKTDPEKHIEYAVQVQGPVRSWTVWHRYSDFYKLDQEFQISVPNKPRPVQLPPKNYSMWPWNLVPIPNSTAVIKGVTTGFGLITLSEKIVNSGFGFRNSSSDKDDNFSSSHSSTDYVRSNSKENKNENNTPSSPEFVDREFVEERRKRLEDYLQAILSCQDDCWRNSTAWSAFLAPEQSRKSHKSAISGGYASEGGNYDSSGERNSSLGRAGGRRKKSLGNHEWIQELRDTEKIALDIRHLIERRENALSRNDVSTSHQCSLQAKRELEQLSDKLELLDHSLYGLESRSQTASTSSTTVTNKSLGLVDQAAGIFSTSPILGQFANKSIFSSSNSGKNIPNNNFVTKGEALRRRDKLLVLMEEKNSLEQLVKGIGFSGLRKGLTVASNADKTALFSLSTNQSKNAQSRVIGVLSGTGGNSRNYTSDFGEMKADNNFYQNGNYITDDQKKVKTNLSPKIDSSGGQRRARVFGSAALGTNGNITPSETNETKSLDNIGILQLQNRMMTEQDNKVKQFAEILRRQKEIGNAIGNELEIHNQLLNDLNEDVDRTGDRLSSVKRQVKKIE